MIKITNSNNKNNLVKLVGLMVFHGKKMLSLKKIKHLLIDLKGYRRFKNKNTKLINLFELLIGKVKPTMGLKNKKVAGKKYKVPYLLEEKRSMRYSLKWLSFEIQDRTKNIAYSKSKNLINNIFDLKDIDTSLKGSGFFIKRLKVHNKEVLENRSYSRFL